MDLYSAIKTRRSIRKYKSEMVSKDSILKILDAANWAPSGMNEQPWEYVVVTGPKLAQIKDVCRDVINLRMPPEAERTEQQKAFALWYSTLGDAPICIVQLTKAETDAGRRKMVLESVSASFQNLLLAAHAEGLGACWMTGPLAMADKLQAILNIANDKELTAITPLGYPAESPAPGKRLDETLQNKVTFVGF